MWQKPSNTELSTVCSRPECIGELAVSLILSLHKIITVSGELGIETFLKFTAATSLCLNLAAMDKSFAGAKVSLSLSGKTKFQDVLLSIMPLWVRDFCGGKSTQSTKLN